VTSGLFDIYFWDLSEFNSSGLKIAGLIMWARDDLASSLKLDILFLLRVYFLKCSRENSIVHLVHFEFQWLNEST
jgi:hypothetical protein